VEVARDGTLERFKAGGFVNRRFSVAQNIFGSDPPAKSHVTDFFAVLLRKLVFHPCLHAEDDRHAEGNKHALHLLESQGLVGLLITC
jgi:hypothetical protein